MSDSATAHALLRRMHECFNTRRFDDADGLFTADYANHILGESGFDSGKRAWRALAEQYPRVQVVAEDVLVDGDRVAIRSSVHGVLAPGTGSLPELVEIFRIEDGRLAEGWGAGTNLPYSAETLR